MISRSGAELLEVGTTNRTRLQDYREAVSENAADGRGRVAAILKVHRSNFRISGFTEEATLAELADLARELGLFLFHDLGSGLLADPAELGLPPEPRAPESLRAGAGAVAISGDKLLGGPQAGIILGEEGVLGAMRKNPLCRAFRVDKVTLAGLEATLRHYLDPQEAIREIPALRMLAVSLEALEKRALGLAAGLGSGAWDARVSQGRGVVGGGTFPGVELPSWTVRVKAEGTSPQDISQRLRAHDPPVVARVENDEVILDLRTVAPGEDGTLLAALREALGAGG
jgi:L-seryl-tRNA(Ser) seleniumtransferase